MQGYRALVLQRKGSTPSGVPSEGSWRLLREEYTLRGAPSWKYEAGRHAYLDCLTAFLCKSHLKVSNSTSQFAMTLATLAECASKRAATRKEAGVCLGSGTL